MNLEMKSTQELINSLTSDEDLRQELWISVLSGTPPAVLSSNLELLHLQYKMVEEFQRNIEIFAVVPLSDKCNRLLSSLTLIERNVVYLLLLGLSSYDIAKYKDIDITKIQQLILSIRSSNLWIDIRKDLNGSEKTSKRR